MTRRKYPVILGQDLVVLTHLRFRRKQGKPTGSIISVSQLLVAPRRWKKLHYDIVTKLGLPRY